MYIAYVGGLFSLSQEINDRSKATNLHPSLTSVGPTAAAQQRQQHADDRPFIGMSPRLG